MPLRIGKLSDEARPLNNGLRRESRRLLKAGFRDEAGKLALADSMDRLKNGNIGSAEQDAETANFEANLTRVSQAQRLREAAGLSRKPVNTPPTSDADTQSSSPASRSPSPTGGGAAAPVAPAAATPAKNTIGTVEGLRGAVKATAEKDRRKALRDAYDKVVDPTGKEKEKEFVSQKIPASLKPSGGGLESTIADIQSRIDSSAALLKKYAKPIETVGPPAPVEMSGPPTRLFVADMQKERGRREAAAAESAALPATPAAPAATAPARSGAFNTGARIHDAIRSSMKGPDYSLPENAPSFTPAEIKKPEIRDIELTPEAKRAAERLKKKVGTPLLDFGKGLLSGS